MVSMQGGIWGRVISNLKSPMKALRHDNEMTLYPTLHGGNVGRSTFCPVKEIGWHGGAGQL